MKIGKGGMKVKQEWARYSASTELYSLGKVGHKRRP